MSTPFVPLRPFLLQGSRGLLHATYFAPLGPPHPAGDVLVVPAFAEEMHRCRAMVAMQARALARIGVGTLVLDLFGTGDSAGDHAGADWPTWIDDLQRGLAWLRSSGNGCSSLLGVRLGALLAAELAQRDGAIERLLLWQPVLAAKPFYTQFLRIRIAAEMHLPDRVKSTGELRERSAAGEAIEVSGYRVGPALARALDEVTLAEPLAVRQVEWLDVLIGADSAPPAASAKAVEGLRAQGIQVDYETVVGPPFWQVHEREIAPALIEATARRVAAWSGGAPRDPATAIAAAAPAEADAAELPLVFPCGDEQLAGVLHRATPDARRGVVVVVAGGPQYRAGAHRQFVSLARKLAAAGFPVLRFDLRGMGDSSGQHLGYQHSDPDIRAAVDALLAQQPQLTDVVLLGECESASGILFYAWRDTRVKGAVLINPWVRTEEGRAQVIVKTYYLDRLRSREFWRNVFTGRYQAGESLSSGLEVLRAFFRGRRLMARSDASTAQDDISALPLPVKTAVGLKRFGGHVLLLMSGRDYIAQEFDEVTRASRAWDGLLDRPQLTRRDIEGADHTFSKDLWKDAAADAVVGWVAGY